jgi:hypothetical protein
MSRTFVTLLLTFWSVVGRAEVPVPVDQRLLKSRLNVVPFEVAAGAEVTVYMRYFTFNFLNASMVVKSLEAFHGDDQASSVFLGSTTGSHSALRSTT